MLKEAGQVSKHDDDRRRFLAGLGAGSVLAVTRGASFAAAKGPHDEVSPTEDLMREHGILRRLLLVYGEMLRRADTGGDLAPGPISETARIIRDFIEGYHERDEEEFIFPRFKKAGRMLGLVNTLLEQHRAGRRITAEILRLSTVAGLASPSDRRTLVESMRLFVRMYEPHAAQEDTVLFPAFRELVGPKQLDKLQDLFEEKENALPGGGFEKMVVEVATIEQAVGIADLASFTPRGP
jgi:hemerythrin-like domain-containing protein